MIVSEAVELLLKLPQSNILVADIGDLYICDIEDILIGTGTNKGFSYVRIKQYEDEEE
ncbi:hypothetical protein [Lacrimispora sp.]|uniref:hypothetical protein n=1 Tax=Lacrimispora sp. TaxID=2719234 RepID=UPI0028AA1324|nr:hypothetical protein [Lacrimispora sp.]